MKIKMLLMLSLAMSSIVASADTITIEDSAAKKLLPAYVINCKALGAEKLTAQANSYGIKVDMNTLRISEVSERGVVNYVWWSVDVTDVNDRTDVFPVGKKAILNKLVQISDGKCY